jgi:8-oxo-dGTP pyrophosphatase MutT (NUDIX family)
LIDVKLVLQREPRTGKTWFPAGSVTANEEPVDAAVRELREEAGLTLTPDDLMSLSDAPVRVALPAGQQPVYVYSAYVHFSYVTSHLRTHYFLRRSRQNLKADVQCVRFINGLASSSR